jgi:hypothetical protein
MARMIFRGSCLAACALAFALEPHAGGRPAAGQRQEPSPTELAWIGLYNQELLDWLENENRLDTLCPTGPGTAAQAECRDEKMQPKAAVIPLRREPRADAERLGEILVVALPGKGLTAFASASRRVERFTPDLYDRDWGYGPFFHQTMLDRRGTWFRVPVPGAGRVWIDAAAWTDARALDAADGVLRTLRAGDIVTTPKGDVVLLSVGDGVLRARAEQDADMWCRPGDPPARVDSPEIRMPFAALFDTDGHLRVRIKYTRGC